MKILFLLLSLTLFTSCFSEKKLIQIQGETMGTYYKVTTYGTETNAELKEDIDTFLRLFNNVFSTYISSSEISKINQSKFEKIKLSDSMNKIMQLSMDISAKSLGYFDISVGPLVNAWGFGPDGKKKEPSTEEIKNLLTHTGFSKITVDDKWIERPIGMYLDLSAIAKGFGVDELVKFLEFRGHGQLLVEIGGEVRTRGKKQDGASWKVGIEGPGKKRGEKLVKVVALVDKSMATSGSYRNYLKYGDKVFNHTINPKTGRPIEHKTLSVSVITDYCADADAWATALMSMGHKKALDLANKLDLSVFIQYKENDQIKTVQSKSFIKEFTN